MLAQLKRPDGQQLRESSRAMWILPSLSGNKYCATYSVYCIRKQAKLSRYSEETSRLRDNLAWQTVSRPECRRGEGQRTATASVIVFASRITESHRFRIRNHGTSLFWHTGVRNWIVFQKSDDLEGGDLSIMSLCPAAPAAPSPPLLPDIATPRLCIDGRSDRPQRLISAGLT